LTVRRFDGKDGGDTPEDERAKKCKDKEEEQPRLCFVFLYEYAVDANPKAGRYSKIGHSELAMRMAYFGPKGGSGGGAIIMTSEELRKKEAAEKAAALAKEEGKDVDPKTAAPAAPPPKQWRPAQGSLIGDSFLQYGGRPAPGGTTPSPADAAKTPPTDSATRATRTEFVVMFLWLEDTPGR
jgi:hypothetical protein